MTEFRFIQMKNAIREAMPAGVGDVTVAQIAAAAMAVAEEWIREAEIDVFTDMVLEASERE